MKSALKWTAVAVAALAVVVIAALLIIPTFIDVNKFKPELEKYLARRPAGRVTSAMTCAEPVPVGGGVLFRPEARQHPGVR